MKHFSKRDLVLYALVGILIIFTFITLKNIDSGADLSYASMRTLFVQQQVDSFSIKDNTITLKLKEQVEGSTTVTYQLYDVQLFYDDLNNLIVSQYDQGIIQDYDYGTSLQNPWWASVLPWVVLIIAFAALWFFILRRQGTGGSSTPDRTSKFGRARTVTLDNEKNKVTFRDVAGADEEKAELEEIVDFLKDPSRYFKMGARVPKGILLVGPPGTGKTLLAKAVAGEAGVRFLSISGSDFVELYVGVGASRVRDLFEQAKKESPAIVFIDEIDAVGRQRGAGLGGGHDEREQTLNQLLVEMDGFTHNEGVIVMAATNRRDILDPALLRPGRFDRQIYVGLPDIKGREDILKVHSKGKPLGEDVVLTTVARATSGFTGADLENLMNEAALLATRRQQLMIAMVDIHDAMMKIIAGPEKRSRVVTEHAKKLTAFHEAGHAIVIHELETPDPVHQITIIPRGAAGGMTISLPQEDKSYQSKQELNERVAVCLGGRVAEQLMLGDISTGASNDLERATSIARAMVTKYGMSDRLGTVVFDTGHD
ncbi:MAG: ATP-dependent metallopeptidase HflB, partial [Oscillospiraceae bacterium]|nr:ATP-dependent metallopeptidase HflB [Oscillospiraceae bacterium]